MLGAEAQQMINAGRAGGELRNIDTMGGGESVRGLARSAANNSPQAREILNQMTDERFTGQGDRFVDFIRNGIGLRFPRKRRSRPGIESGCPKIEPTRLHANPSAKATGQS